MACLLDTHAALWLAEGSPRLSANALTILRPLRRDDLLLLDVSLSEAARLIHVGKVRLSVPARQGLQLFTAAFTVLPVSPDIAWAAAAFNWTHRDPCDRQIVAAAAVLGVPLVTADATMTAFAASLGVKVVW